MKSAEQQARDLLQRLGVEDAQSLTAGDLVEIANLLAASQQPAIQFRVSSQQCEKVEKWMRKRIHNRAGYHGLREWIFGVGSGIGTSLRVRCTCGLELDVTEYDNW
jgi:hypothetical protein